MKFDKNLATIHGYLCADGYVIKNPKTQKHKYYHIGLRNTNDILLKDFQNRFKKVFNIKPIITNDGRCRIQSKEIFEKLTKKYSYYSHEWQLPKISKSKLKFWLRAFFDCEAWVECQEAKNRAIRIDCVNISGMKDIQNALINFGIKSSIKKRNRPIWRLNICGLDDIKKFHKEIGFLHQDKNKLLEKAISSYKDYNWKIPQKKNELKKFINKQGKKRILRNEMRFFSIKKNNLVTLKNRLSQYGIDSKIYGPWKNSYGSLYYCLLLKLDDVKK
ncbi:MAG: LAGLIDADG family homing endonuclease [Candidatus Aenigmatarchaeota archaeon]